MSNLRGDKGNWIVLAILVILASPAVFLFGLMMGSGFDSSTLTTSSNLAVWVSALSTLVIAVLTIVLAKETWHLRRIQLDQLESIRKSALQPAVDVYLQRSNVAFVLMDVVVENAGAGTARNVRFDFSGLNGKPLSDHEKLVVDELHKLNILKNGMLSLGAGKSRKSFAFQVNQIFSKVQNDFFEIKIQIRITYEDIEGKAFENVVIWDFAEYVGVGEVGGGDPHHQSAKELEKIRKALEAYKRSSSSDRLKVDVYTAEERAQERKDLHEHYEAIKAKQAEQDDS